jgi:hypothetical protein
MTMVMAMRVEATREQEAGGDDERVIEVAEDEDEVWDEVDWAEGVGEGDGFGEPVDEWVACGGVSQRRVQDWSRQRVLITGFRSGFVQFVGLGCGQVEEPRYV